MLIIINNNQTSACYDCGGHRDGHVRTVPLEYPIEYPILEYPTGAHRYGTDTSIKKIVDNSQVPCAS
jgi:hypothetical protein